MRSLDHPYILKLVFSFQTPSNLYMAIEYCPNGDLSEILDECSLLDEEIARFLIAELILAMKYMHERGIIFRDLKPENIMINADGYLNMIDFGFAKVITKRTYTICGTPEYIAPEILLNQGHGKAVDWWTVGILLYEMLAGYPPF